LGVTPISTRGATSHRLWRPLAASAGTLFLVLRGGAHDLQVLSVSRFGVATILASAGLLVFVITPPRRQPARVLVLRSLDPLQALRDKLELQRTGRDRLVGSLSWGSSDRYEGLTLGTLAARAEDRCSYAGSNPRAARKLSDCLCYLRASMTQTICGSGHVRAP
jgi:hypothetical protein